MRRTSIWIALGIGAFLMVALQTNLIGDLIVLLLQLIALAIIVAPIVGIVLLIRWLIKRG